MSERLLVVVSEESHTLLVGRVSPSDEEGKAAVRIWRNAKRNFPGQEFHVDVYDLTRPYKYGALQLVVSHYSMAKIKDWYAIP